MKKQFNDFEAKYTFKGFDIEQLKRVSNSHLALTGKHVSDDNNNAVIRISDNHIIKTQYGYAVIVSNTEVVFIKSWQVWGTYNGTYVINFNREFFQIKKWGNHNDFSEKRTFNNFDDVVKLAKEQEEFYNKENKEFIY